MKLTEKQNQVIQKAKQLETEYGSGNVFIRWVNDYWRTCFIIHKQGDNTYKPLMTEGTKVNGTILKALGKKGLLTGCDNQHNDDVDPNSWRNKPEGWYYVGSRIKTDLVTE
jgi:hypothetical protein